MTDRPISPRCDCGCPRFVFVDRVTGRSSGAMSRRSHLPGEGQGRDAVCYVCRAPISAAAPRPESPAFIPDTLPGISVDIPPAALAATMARNVAMAAKCVRLSLRGAGPHLVATSLLNQSLGSLPDEVRLLEQTLAARAVDFQ